MQTFSKTTDPTLVIASRNTAPLSAPKPKAIAIELRITDVQVSQKNRTHQKQEGQRKRKKTFQTVINTVSRIFPLIIAGIGGILM